MKSFWGEKWSWWYAGLLVIVAVVSVSRPRHQREEAVAETLFYLVDVDPSEQAVTLVKEGSHLVQDALEATGKPRNFRHTGLSLVGRGVNVLGMDRLRAFASGVFDAQHLIKVKAFCPGRIKVMDLRQEDHGFLNELPISWFGRHNWANREKSNLEVELGESQAIAALLARRGERLYRYSEDQGTPGEELDCVVDRVESEREMIERLGLDYQRFYVADHYFASPQELDRFVACLESQENDEWWYFHCRAGRGRSTTFMIMYDSWLNAGEVSFEDILERQRELGGRDLKEFPHKDSYKYNQAVERLKMAQRFYDYCLYRRSGGGQPWSKWLQGV